ncbi:MAG: restriction endonuclease [Sphingobacteriales bacterium]|nr:MAG: restriction endonuclease [Sphingobacteriales bacterium]
MPSKNHFTVFEHETLRVQEGGLTSDQLQILVDYYGEGCPYFSLVYRGIKFNEYVGVLQAGPFTIEVLPKADRDPPDDSPPWRNFLITMLRAAGLLPEPTGLAALHLRAYSILDGYMLLFLQETRYLIQTGLVRRYRTTEGNSSTLKGSLQFAQHIRHNGTHAERFYTRHTVYDQDHLHNALLRQTLQLIARIARAPDLSGAARTLLLNIPECQEAAITETLFETLTYSRTTASYRPAHQIARLLLLAYHPDVRRGSNNVLALLFDANMLWEKYILQRLRQELNQRFPGTYLVREQVRTNFWQPAGGVMRSVKPDLVVYEAAHPETAILVLDTKWKRIPDNRPADNDLKQMLVYNLYQGCGQSALVYPASRQRTGIAGHYQSVHGTSCSLQFVSLQEGAHGIQAHLEPLLQLITA